MKVLSLFSGVGAFEKALTNLKIPFELMGFSEIHKPAIKAYCSLHGVDTSLNLGDVDSINPDNPKLQNLDLVTYGFPCQDISISGKRRGFTDASTRSGLLWSALRLIKQIKPKMLIAENVLNLVNGFYPEFLLLLEFLSKELGYGSQYFVLNSADYGSVQVRQRVFIVSMLRPNTKRFNSPEAVPNNTTMGDIVEPTKITKCLLDLTTYSLVPVAINSSHTKQIYNIPEYAFDSMKKVFSLEGKLPTLTQRNNFWIQDQFNQIRSITGKESCLLTGFSLEDYGKFSKVVSDSQIVKLMGNSIDVSTLEALFKVLFQERLNPDVV